jgi:uncharacterized protein (DUF1778 family)
MCLAAAGIEASHSWDNALVKGIPHALSSRRFNRGQKRLHNAQATIRTARIQARSSRRAGDRQTRGRDSGRSVSDFVVAAAQEPAPRTIKKTEIIRLNAETIAPWRSTNPMALPDTG